MIDAIIYYSRHGSTKKYALACAKMLNVKCISLDNAKKELKKNSSIIFFSSVKGAKLRKYGYVEGRYDIKMVCAVGILPKTILTIENIKNENIIYKPIIYLRGELDYTKLSFFEKRYLNMFRKNIAKYLEVYYDTALDEDEALSILSKEKSNFYNEADLLVVNKYFDNENNDYIS